MNGHSPDVAPDIAPDIFPDAFPDVAYCDRCGEPRTAGAPQAPDPHAACRQARTLEPPRFCGLCRRRMVVQVTPRGWTARCVEHGVLAGEGAAPARPAARAASPPDPPDPPG